MLSDEEMDLKRKIYGRCSYFEAFPEAAAKYRVMRAQQEAELDARVDRLLGAALETTHPFGSDFFHHFVNIKTEAPVSHDELEHAQREHWNSNLWVSQRYTSCRRTYDAPITLDSIRAILGCLDPYILEDILLLGVAVDIRCILSPALCGLRPVEKARPSRDVLVKYVKKHPRHWRHDLQLCNARLHDKDSERGVPNDVLQKKIKHPYEHARMRTGLGRLIGGYIDVKDMGDLQHAIDTEYSRIRTKDLDSHLNLDSVVNIFDSISRGTNAGFMEYVFVLGCAAALRNLVTCFEGIMVLDKHDDDTRYDDLKWYFRYCNTKNFELGLNRGANFRHDLHVYYHMLSDILHGLDVTSHNLFFRGPLFTERFNTIRWEVLNLVFTFLAKLPDHTPIRSRLFLSSLVRFGAMPDEDV